MFTGIITAVGQVTRVGAATDASSSEERELTLLTPYLDAELGESIAVNGVCLTVASKRVEGKQAWLTFFASRETCTRTNLGDLAADSRVNLERALSLQEKLSGHLVQGHVDGRARLLAVSAAGQSWELEVELPDALSRYVIEKGSITLDGISLTVNSIKDSKIYLMIIPHTWEHTSLSSKRVGQDFNVEVDVIAKYVEKLTLPYRGANK